MSDREIDFIALVEGRSGAERGKARLGCTDNLETVPFVDGTSQGKVKGGELKELAALQVKSIDKPNRRITALASADTLDRDNELIEPEAFRKWMPVYMKNPVVLTSHVHRLDSGQSSVIANVVDYGINKKGLTAVIEFHSITGLAEEYWQLYSQKKQRAFSVGFIPHASEDRLVEDKRVRVYTEIELIEISCVPVPSNREALSRSKQGKADFVAAKKTERGCRL